MKINGKYIWSMLCFLPLGLLAGCGSSGSGSTPKLPGATSTSPAITQQPTNQTATAGQTATFMAAASGTPAPTVQWQVSANAAAFTNVAGATSATLALTGTTASQNGNQYQAVFTNSAGSATTTAATLTVNFAPQITQQPTNQTANAGGPANFTALASGNPAPTVQWQVSVSGGAFTNISGATSTTLALTGTTTSQNGNQYQAVFTNSVSSTTSAAATLTVNAPAAVNGAAFDGPVVGATINAYSFTSTGVESTSPIATAITNADGGYTLTLPTGFMGPVLLTSIGGTYKDDATGNTEQAGELSVLIPNGSGTVMAEMTPLTSMAAQLAVDLAAASQTSPATIANDLNMGLGMYFGGAGNPANTALVDVTAPNCTQNVSQASVDSSVIVAGLSQVAANNGVSSASLTNALIEDFKANGTFTGSFANGTPIPVPLANGSGSINLCTIEGNCAGSTGSLPQVVALAIPQFLSSLSNVCGATITSGTLANLNTPASVTPSSLFGIIPVNISGTITGLNPGQSVQLRVGTIGLPSHCVVTSGPGCPGAGFSITGTGSFSSSAQAPYAGFTGYILILKASDPQNESCSLGGVPITGSVTPYGPVILNGIQINCSTVTYPVTVDVGGLTAGQSLQLQDSGTDTLTVTTNGFSSFSTQLTLGSAYNVTILTQPTSETCTVASTGLAAGMGTIGVWDIVNVGCGTAGVASILNNPNGIVLSNDQTLLYLANAGGNQVLVYNIARNPATGAATGMILVDTITADITNPTRLAFDPTGRYLYVTNFGPSGSKGWVSVYDTAFSNTEITADKISTGSISRPLGVAVDGQGNVYVADNASNAISVYQPTFSGNFQEASFSPLSTDAAGDSFLAPGAMLFYSLSGFGDFLVVGTGAGDVFAYPTPLTNTSSPLFTLTASTCTNAPTGPTGFAAFTGLSGGPPSSFFISNFYAGDALDFGIDSFFSGNACPAPLTQSPAGSNKSPEGIAVDVFGNVFVTNAGANSMFVYANGGLAVAPTLTVQ
jgi:hypothetical protein